MSGGREVRIALPGLADSLVRLAAEDGYRRLLAPGVERDVRASESDEADQHAIQVFTANLRKLSELEIAGVELEKLETRLVAWIGTVLIAFHEHLDPTSHTTVIPLAVALLAVIEVERSRRRSEGREPATMFLQDLFHHMHAGRRVAHLHFASQYGSVTVKNPLVSLGEIAHGVFPIHKSNIEWHGVQQGSQFSDGKRPAR